MPAHTRNDSHGPFEPYEAWTDKNKDILPYTQYGSDPWNYWEEYRSEFPEGTVAPGDEANYHAFIDLNTPVLPDESLNQGLSQYSHAGFLSEDSVFTFAYPEKPAWFQNQSASYDPADVTFETREIHFKPYKFVFLKKDDMDHFALSGILYHLNWPWGTDNFAPLFSVDDPLIHEAYARKLVPRAVGYSAGLLDYFLRGKIEISVPETPVSINPVEMGIDRLKLSAKNVTPEEDMSGGRLVLSVKYKRDGDESYKYITKEVDAECSLVRNETVTYDIDLAGNEIPIDAAEICIYLVYRGRLGNETDGIAVGMLKDPPMPKLVQNPVITLPESGVYALTDTVPADPAAEGFDRIAFSVTDTAGGGVVPDNGEVTAVLWYSVSQDNPFQTLPPDQFPRPEDYFVSERTELTLKLI